MIYLKGETGNLNLIFCIVLPGPAPSPLMSNIVGLGHHV